MSRKVTIELVDTLPEKDLYHLASLSSTDFWVNPKKRTCGVCQESYPSSSTYEKFLGDIFSFSLHERNDCRKDADEIENFLYSEAGQELLALICDGWYQEWDGRNLRGYLDDDAREAVDTLLSDISRLPERELSILDPVEWYAEYRDSYVNALSTDEEVAITADEEERIATEEGYFVLGSVRSVFINWRDEELDAWLSRAKDLFSKNWVARAKVSHCRLDEQTLEVEFLFSDGTRGVVHVTDKDEQIVVHPDD